MKYTLIPDNTPEEEVVLYHLRGNAISRADMIGEMIEYEIISGVTTRYITSFELLTDDDIERQFNQLREHKNYVYVINPKVRLNYVHLCN